ncbi:MAG: DUF4124 domain-containing protein [Waddliaceae bacterium]
MKRCDFIAVDVRFLCIKVASIFLFVATTLLLAKFSVDAATFYKYTDKNGTVVFTEVFEQIPFDLRDSAKKMTMADEGLEKKSTPLISEDITNRIKNNQLGEKHIRQGREVLSSFLKDQKYLVIGYIVGGILLFIVLTSILKRFVSGFLSKIVIHFAIVVVLFSGGYLFYLSWLNETVLGFGQDSSSSTALTDRITTPKEILEKTQLTVDQLNASSEAREKMLEELD